MVHVCQCQGVQRWEGNIVMLSTVRKITHNGVTREVNLTVVTSNRSYRYKTRCDSTPRSSQSVLVVAGVGDCIGSPGAPHILLVSRVCLRLRLGVQEWRCILLAAE